LYNPLYKRTNTVMTHYQIGRHIRKGLSSTRNKSKGFWETCPGDDFSLAPGHDSWVFYDEYAEDVINDATAEQALREYEQMRQCTLEDAAARALLCGAKDDMEFPHDFTGSLQKMYDNAIDSFYLVIEFMDHYELYGLAKVSMNLSHHVKVPVSKLDYERISIKLEQEYNYEPHDLDNLRESTRGKFVSIQEQLHWVNSKTCQFIANQYIEVDFEDYGKIQCTLPAYFASMFLITNECDLKSICDWVSRNWGTSRKRHRNGWVCECVLNVRKPQTPFERSFHLTRQDLLKSGTGLFMKYNEDFSYENKTCAMGYIGTES
jgi:hypothetical protein